jgi:hypothetical protein
MDLRNISSKLVKWIHLAFIVLKMNLEFHKSGEFLDGLNNYQLFKEHLATWS